MHTHRRAFTLIELSIVLVIIGLLVGGVLAGQSLIRAAELRAITREFQAYQTALGAFKDKYDAIPGDMVNAVKYWGAQVGATTNGFDATCAVVAVAPTGTATCNGDGDGYVLNVTTTVPLPHELFRAWQHLANAGLVEGSFTGVHGAAGVWDAVIGQNIPRSKVANAGWFLMSTGEGVYTDAYYFPASYGNFLLVGGYFPNGGPVTAVLKPEDAYNIDMKLDDGKPNTGNVLTYKTSLLPNCAVSTNDAYNLASTAIGCSMLFITGF